MKGPEINISNSFWPWIYWKSRKGTVHHFFLKWARIYCLSRTPFRAGALLDPKAYYEMERFVSYHFIVSIFTSTSPNLMNFLCSVELNSAFGVKPYELCTLQRALGAKANFSTFRALLFKLWFIQLKTRRFWNEHRREGNRTNRSKWKFSSLQCKLI